MQDSCRPDETFTELIASSCATKRPAVHAHAALFCAKLSKERPLLLAALKTIYTSTSNSLVAEKAEVLSSQVWH